MSKPGWIWKIYAVYITFLMIQGNVDIFSPSSSVYIFYHILMAFDKSFRLVYFTHVGSVLVDTLSLVPLYLFVFQKKFLNPAIWQWLFVLRLPLDLLGHFYHRVFLKSLWATDVWLGIQVLVGGIFLLIPFFGACFLYAFRQEEIFSKPSSPPGRDEGTSPKNHPPSRTDTESPQE